MTEINEYVETVGLFYEKFGLPRMSGRILGLLMASKKELLNFEEIRIQLNASKGSISNNINNLMIQGIINRTMKPGDRKTYYSFFIECIQRVFFKKIESITEMKKLLVLANTLNGAESEKHHKIEDVIDFYLYLEQELPKLEEKWKKQRKSQLE